MKLLSLTEFINERYQPSYTNIILEGGAFGHMSHPFEDFSLTFTQVKDIIKLSLQGELNKDINAEEKLDGQALAISWKNGAIVAARNKGDRRDFGKNALSEKDLIQKFKNHPENVSNAFSFAIKDLQNSLSKLNKDELNKIFNEGHNFAHLEILWPDSSNVINYGVARLIFHTVTEYDESGKPINDFPEFARTLEKIISSVNSSIQKNFEIIPHAIINLPKHIDFSKKEKYFLKKVNKLESESGLSDNDRIEDYLNGMFLKEIQKHDEDSELTEIILTGLLDRWVNLNKAYRIPNIKTDIKNPNFLEWILSFDKNEAQKKRKEYLTPLELLFLELGVTILKNASGFLAVNPDESVQKIRNDLNNAIKQIESSGDVKKLNVLQAQMSKIDAIGGFDAIVPTEGIVFSYNGKSYKFTGIFAPINQITGLLKF